VPAPDGAPVELRWPSQVTDLRLAVDLREQSNDAAHVNALLQSVSAQLQHLTQLSLIQLGIHGSPNGISFEPLAALTRLEYFYCNWQLSTWTDLLLSDAQVQQLKALTSLRHLHLAGGAMATTRLLSPPHQWRLEELESGWSSDLLQLLPSVPTLRRLDVRLISGDGSFLAGLPNLTDLLLVLNDSPMLNVQAVLAALRHCTQLTKLELRIDGELRFGGAESADYLRPLTQLRSLTVAAEAGFRGLAFIDALPRELTELELGGLTADALRPPSTALQHIQSLTALQGLRLTGVIIPSAATTAAVQELRAALPLLKRCEGLHGTRPAGSGDAFESSGGWSI